MKPMQEIQIRALDKDLAIHFSGQSIKLPQLLREQIQAHWNDLLREKPSLHNGEVFTILDVRENSATIRIELAETDYAHYLYSLR